MDENKYARPARNVLINGQERIPVIICVDRSGSMFEKVPGLEKSKLRLAYECIMEYFIKQILSSGNFKHKVDLAVVVFGEGAKVVKPFAPITDTKENEKIIGITQFERQESGDLYKGVEKCLEILNQRKQYYDQNQVRRRAAWLVILSDGKPSVDGVTKGVTKLPKYERMRLKLRDLEENSNLNIIPVCFYEYDPDYKDYRKDKGYLYLSSLTKAINEGLTIPVVKKGQAATDFQKFFRNLSSSVRAGSKNNVMGGAQTVVKEAPVSSVQSADTSVYITPTEEPEVDSSEILTAAENNVVEEAKEEQVVEEAKAETVVEVKQEQPEILERPKFTVYLNSARAIVSRLSVGPDYLAGYTLLANSNSPVLEVERHGLGKLQFEDNSRAFTIEEKGRYEIYITNKNRVIVVLKESYEAKPKAPEMEQSENTKVNQTDALSNLEEMLSSVLGTPSKK